MTPQFSDQFFASAAKKLPYTPLQYLESTGTQYIDTGTAPDFAGGDEIRLRCYRPSGTGGTTVFGSRQQPVARNGVYVIGDGGVIVCDGESFSAAGVAVPLGDVVLTVNDSIITANATTVTMPKRVTSGLPVFLFCLNSYGSPAGYYPGVRFYEFSYYRNGVLAQHLVPALDANAVPCMWDTVSNTAKYNAGTGTFNYA